MAPRIFFKHFDNEPADAAKFYELIGRIIVVWGRIEASMDNALLEIMHHRAAIGERQPVTNNFTHKMKCWKAVFESEPMVADCREDALGLVPVATSLHEARNRLIHGSLDHLQPDRTSVAFKFDHKKSKTYYNTYRVGLADLEEHLQAALVLSERVGAEALGVMLRSIAPDPGDVRRSRQNS